MSKVREASHAGSWYSNNASELNKELSNWLSLAAIVHSPAKAIIAPHAGYYYCGSCGAFAYKQINPQSIRRVFIMGPSHHIHLTDCAISQVEVCKTPLYDLQVDKKVCSELMNTGLFQHLSISDDEDEHSIEMQLPYIAKTMESHKGNFTVIPILVGSLSFDKEKTYGKLLSPYLADPDNLFIISSDFCHWGHRFKYTHYDNSYGEIWQSVEHVDHLGMNLIENMDHEGFYNYLKTYHNTICGRHPIGVLLATISVLKELGSYRHFSLKFTNYQQSAKCRTMKDSSVSYASAAFIMQ